MNQEKPIDLTKHDQPARPQPVETATFRPETRQLGRLQRLGRYLRERWEDEDRPGLFELHVYYLPVAVAIAGGAIATSDEILGTHLADDMARVQVEKHANIVYQTVEEAIQDIGKAAGGHTKK